MLTLPGSPGGWYMAALCTWAVVTIVGALRRNSSGFLLPIGLGIGSALLLLTAVAGGNQAMILPMPWFLAVVPFQFMADPLSRWFLGIIGLVGIAAAVFSPGYLHHLRKRVALGFVWSALSLLMVSMSLVVLSANALAFLVAWEVMALSSLVLVASDHEQRSVQRAALIYLGATRTGTAFLMAGFLWAHHLTGSWDFSAWHLSGGAAIGPALLIFVGLAVKAGCWPFHLWLPIAHPAAPAPVSAVMSGVMIKTAIYAMIRLLAMGHIDCPAIGPIVLILGAISAFWGVLFALLQHDLKRLLAYHSVENIGIILMGLGLSMIGAKIHQPLLAQLGLAAALFHTLNHALFKSLLFLGAGVVDARAHTRDVELLGGLIHKMPWTAGSFIIGSAAICALPPLNGFASEWLLYKGFFGLAQHGANVGGRLCGLLLIGWLALIGALAVACFVKAVGVVFLGLPRSEQASQAREGTRGMVVAQVILAVVCAGLGIGASAVLAPLGSVVAFAQGSPTVLAGAWTLPIPILVVTLALALVTLALWMSALARSKPARRFITWECGFGDLGPRMQYTASSFAQPIARMFSAVNRYTVQVDVQGHGRKHFPHAVSAESEYEPYLQTRVYAPVLKLIQDAAGAFLARLQAGSIHQYLAYMMVTLALLLFLGVSPMILLLLACINIVVIPLLLMGVIRKIKARMQNRVGAPVLQAFYDIGKLLRKGETISETASWVFVLAPRLNLVVVAVAALLIPWSGAAIPGEWSSATNFLLVVYLVGLGKFISMLAAMDTGSAFGGLGASREALISLLVEPALMIGLGALAFGANSMDLSVIYSTSASQSVAVLVGASFVIAALAELSRMPVDDPTTHLELTMVHEAMILENSGRNLALVELSVALRTCIFFGLAAQTFLHALPQYVGLSQLLRYGVGIVALFVVGALVAVAEGVLVKLNWRRMPNFVAFAIALSSLAALIAVARG